MKELTLNFENGLQVLTGETGAGKSIIVGAINIILGGDFSKGIHFDKAHKVVLEATFTIDEQNKLLHKLIKKYDIDKSENELFITKEISPNFRSKIFLNGRRISIPIVEEFRSALIDFHSQRDQQQLFDNDYQLEILDRFGDLFSLRLQFEKKYLELEIKIKELKKLEKNEKENSDKIKLYKYQIEEIESLNLKIGEEEKLQCELELLSNAEEILEQSSKMESTIFENENSVYDSINAFVASFSHFEENNKHIKNAVSSLKDSLTNLSDSVEEIRALQGVINLDSARKEMLADRLNEINEISLKHKKNIPQILEYLKKIKQEIANFSSKQENIKNLINEIKSKTEKLIFDAEILSQKRKEKAIKFQKEIEKNIKELSIPDAKVKINFDKKSDFAELKPSLEDLHKFGKDAIDIYFSANKGVRLQPFKIVASGGELSRFLLVIKKILSKKMDKKTIIFDEIDQGIGGKTSEFLADFIYKVGDFHQVLCISHLPQIAAYADTHFAISKSSNDQNAMIKVSKLNKKNRCEEIARMLSGSLTMASQSHAEELINKKLRRR